MFFRICCDFLHSRYRHWAGGYLMEVLGDTRPMLPLRPLQMPLLLLLLPMMTMNLL